MVTALRIELSSCKTLFLPYTLFYYYIVIRCNCKITLLKHLCNRKHSDCSLDICCMQNKTISSVLAAFSIKYFVYLQSLRKKFLFNIYQHFRRKTSSFKTCISGTQKNCKCNYDNGKHFLPEVSWSGKSVRKLCSCNAI